MSANQAYDPRYNAKIYVPKLTEEQRRARATPLENLRSLRFRTEKPAATSEATASSPAPSQNESATPPPSVNGIPNPTPQTAATTSPTTEFAVPVSVHEKHQPSPHHIPTAREVLFAEFPELFPLVYEEVHQAERSAFGEPYLAVGGPQGTVLHAKARDPQECFPSQKTPTTEPGRPQRAGPSPDFKNAGRSRTPGRLRRAGFTRPTHSQGPLLGCLCVQDGPVATLA